MEQAFFRIGGVYRQRKGDVVRLEAADQYWNTGCEHGAAAYEVAGAMFQRGARRRSDGKAYPYETDESSEYDLIPGELHLFNGEWLPVEEKAEQPMAPYFAEAVEAKYCPDCGTTEGSEHFAFCQHALTPEEARIRDLYLFGDPNAAMILRDGPQITRPAPPPVAQEATSHAPLAGLTVLMERDHRLGSCVVHGD